MVFYFTATGNSLYIAKRLDDNPISIPQINKQSNLCFSDKSIGIVSPVYCGEIPHIVFDFIKKSKFNTPYLYMILTYGMDESDSPQFTYNQCRNAGVSFDYINCIKMVDNYLPAFDMNEQKAMDKNIDGQLSAIKEEIRARKKAIPTATADGIRLHKKVALMNKIFPSVNNGKAIKVTDKCTGCKICTQVCPIGNIAVITDYAQRLNKKCEFCLACVHNCPHNAIKLKMDKNPNARYINENISLDEIIYSNTQRKGD